MIIISTKNIKIITGFVLVVMFLAIYNPTAIASITLQTARVFYREDGGVSITQFLVGACRGGETEVQCMDRISAENPGTLGLPYDDIDPNQLPQDRKDRDKWRGTKGRGIWIDTSLVTKTEKIQELQEELDEELDKDSPDSTKVLKIQRQIEKVRDIDNNILTKEDLTLFEERQRSFVATAIQTVSDLFSGILNSIKEGFLALRSLVTEKIQVGTAEKPSGVTVYDINTKQPYCIVVSDGKLENIPGECGSTVTDYSAPPQNDNSVILNGSEGSPDIIPPIINLNGINPTEIEIGSTYSDLGATVSDNVSQNLGYKVKLDDGPEIYPNDLVLDTSMAGEHIITYIAVDQAGNQGIATRTIKIVDPNAQPEEPAPDPVPTE